MTLRSPNGGTDGRIGRVKHDYPGTELGQKFMGWSPPYFPKAG